MPIQGNSTKIKIELKQSIPEKKTSKTSRKAKTESSHEKIDKSMFFYNLEETQRAKGKFAGHRVSQFLIAT